MNQKLRSLHRNGGFRNSELYPSFQFEDWGFLCLKMAILKIKYENKYILHCLALLIPFSISFLGCSEQTERLSPALKVTFFPMGAKIHFDVNRQMPVKHIRAVGSEGDLVAQLDIGGYPRNTEPLYFRWMQGKAIDLTLRTPRANRQP